MLDEASRLHALLDKCAREELTVDEQLELDKMLYSYFQDEKKKALKRLSDEGTLIERLQQHDRLRQLLANMPEADPSPHVIRKMSRRTYWFRYLTSAAIIFGIVMGVYLWSGGPDDHQEIYTASQQERFRNEVPAATDGAVLTLADGSQVVLDNKNGTIASQGDVQVVKEGGMLNYRAIPGTAKGEIAYNSVATPRGKYISLTLSDKSVVWLNAASRIRYPVEFVGNERRVEISGEAFFDIAKNGKPFIVETNGLQIEVTGTQFNVCAYENEVEIKTTLVEGAVNVTKGNASLTLAPGQQAVVKTGVDQQGILLNKEVNIQEHVAWKEGLFHFEDTSIQDIMQQLSRWYDIEVTFKAKANKHYYFTIGRHEPLTNLLKIMEIAGNIRFVIDGRNITVIP